MLLRKEDTGIATKEEERNPTQLMALEKIRLGQKFYFAVNSPRFRFLCHRNAHYFSSPLSLTLFYTLDPFSE